MVTSLPSLPSPSSHSKKSTYIPRYDSTTHNNSPTSPSSSSSLGNNIQSISLPTTSKNSLTRPHNHSNHVILPPPMASFSSSPPDSPASSTGSSRSQSGKSSASPSFHSVASSSYTQKMARREKRHFQSSPSSTYSSSTSSSSSSGQNKKKGGVTFLSSQPSLPFMNRSAPMSASALAQPTSTAKPKDRFISRSPLSFTALSKESLAPAKSPLAAADTAAAPTSNSSSEKQQPAPKIALQPTPSTASNHNNGRIRASLRNRISTWASTVRQSFTAAHQDHSSSLSSSPAPISPNTPTRVIQKPLPSESHSALPSPYSSAQELPIPTTTPVLFSSKEDLADMTVTPYPAQSPKEVIGGQMTSTLLRQVQDIEKTSYDKEMATSRHSHHFHPSAVPLTPARSTPKLVVQTTPPKYPAPAAAARPTAQYTPGPASVFGRSKSRNPFATPTTPIPTTASSPLTTPTLTTATTTKAKTKTPTFQSSLERARFLNQSRRRKVGSGLITLFCIAAIVILILC